MEEVQFSQKSIDFANVFKAFIGSSYLSMPFAFHQSGIIFGVIMLLVIGALTDYCCYQIVRCKAIIISRLVDQFEIKLNSGLLPRREAELFQNGQLKSRWENKMTLGHIAKYAYGKKAQWVVTICLFVSQFGFCVGYFVFIGNTVKELLYHEIANGSNQPNGTTQHSLEGQGVGYDVPLSYLVMTPLPLFILFAMLRSVRNIGWVSAVATATVAFGYFSVLGILLNGFTVNIHFSYVQFATLPMVFGMLTCGFEGIGTVIPIESSMIGNRHNFSPYLHISMALMVIILGSFGVLGHLRYGGDTKQIVLQNMPYSIFVSVVNCVLILGVLCTYPLQMFPVSEITEFLFFRKTSSDLDKERLHILNEERSINNNTDSKRNYDDELLSELTGDEDNAAERTINDERSGGRTNYGADFTDGDETEEQSVVGNNSVFTKKEERMIRIIHGSKITAPAWKRNCLRAVLVLIQMGLAVVMRDNYAYLNAFIAHIITHKAGAFYAGKIVVNEGIVNAMQGIV